MVLLFGFLLLAMLVLVQVLGGDMSPVLDRFFQFSCVSSSLVFSSRVAITTKMCIFAPRFSAVLSLWSIFTDCNSVWSYMDIDVAQSRCLLTDFFGREHGTVSAREVRTCRSIRHARV